MLSLAPLLDSAISVMVMVPATMFLNADEASVCAPSDGNPIDIFARLPALSKAIRVVGERWDAASSAQLRERAYLLPAAMANGYTVAKFAREVLEADCNNERVADIIKAAPAAEAAPPPAERLMSVPGNPKATVGATVQCAPYARKLADELDALSHAISTANLTTTGVDVQPVDKSQGDLADLPADRIAAVKEFLSGIRSIKFLNPDGKPRPEWKIFYGGSWQDAKLAAHKGALSDPDAFMWSFAFTAADVGAFKAAEASKRKAAIDWVKKLAIAAVNNAVKEPQANFAPRAALDVALMASLIALGDVKFDDKEKYLMHASERMEVWRKGYALLDDVNGVLYVYCKLP